MLEIQLPLCTQLEKYMQHLKTKVGNVTITNSGGNITLEIPQGMTGRQLVRFKNRNKAAMLALGVSVPPLPVDDLGEDSEGDRLCRASGL